MSKNWILVDSQNIVENIIVADSKEIAEAITGLLAIELTDTHRGNIGDLWLEELDKFKPKQPFLSWIFDEVEWCWKAPIEKPEGDNHWNESTLQWVLKPDSGMWKWDGEKQEWIERTL